MILSDLGADVIKVEPPKGDTTRMIGPHTELDDEHHYGGYYASINRNKRSIVLDLKDPDDKAILLRLIDTADVLVENYRAAELCHIMGRDDMIADDRFKSSRRRVLNRELVREIITAWTGVRTKEQIVDALAGRVPTGPVNDARDLFASQHVRDRQMLVAVEHAGSERPVLTPNTAIRFAETQGGVYRRAPKLGEHGDEILAELAEIEKRRGAQP